MIDLKFCRLMHLHVSEKYIFKIFSTEKQYTRVIFLLPSLIFILDRSSCCIEYFSEDDGIHMYYCILWTTPKARMRIEQFSHEGSERRRVALREMALQRKIKFWTSKTKLFKCRSAGLACRGLK